MTRILLGAIAILALGAALSWAQQALDPAPAVAVCAYSTSPPTVTTGQFVYMQCDSTGKLLVH